MAAREQAGDGQTQLLLFAETISASASNRACSSAHARLDGAVTAAKRITQAQSGTGSPLRQPLQGSCRASRMTSNRDGSDRVVATLQRQRLHRFVDQRLRLAPVRRP